MEWPADFSVPDFDHIEVFRNGSALIFMAPGQNYTIDDGAPKGTKVTYEIKAINTSGAIAAELKPISVDVANDNYDFSALSNNERLLLVYRSDNAESADVASHYQKKRAIPDEMLCPVSGLSSSTNVDWNEYQAKIAGPIRDCMLRVHPQRPLFIVFTYNTPYITMAAPSRVDYSTGVSLDQYVSDIWSLLISGKRYLNSYAQYTYTKKNEYIPFESLNDYRKKNSRALEYSVMRLDGATVAIAKGLVDSAMQAEAQGGLKGIGYFDRNRGPDWVFPGLEDVGYLAGDWDIHNAAVFWKAAGFDTVEDGNEQEFGTAPAQLVCENAAMYAGWYSYNNYNDAFNWAPGSIGFHLDSFSAGNPRGGTNWSAGALQKGIAVTGGALAEPYLEGLLAVDGFMSNILGGHTVGESILRNQLYARWHIIYMGDPLYVPFKK